MKIVTDIEITVTDENNEDRSVRVEDSKVIDR